MDKRKSKDAERKDEQIEWKNPIELKVFCGLCATQVLIGNRSGGSLKNEGYDEVIKWLKLINKVVSQLQVKNKWDHLRGVWKVWNVWKQLFERETGLGYDPDIGKIDASDEWWERKLKVSLLQRMLETSIFYN